MRPFEAKRNYLEFDCYLLPSLAEEAGALGMEGPARYQVPHRGSVVTLSQAQLLVKRMRGLNALQVDLDAQPGTGGQLDFAVDDGERLLGQALAILPDPVRIDGCYLSRSSGRYMGEHGERD